MDKEKSLRAQLGYFAWSCALCQTRFLIFTDAQKHFTSRFSRHKGQKPAILENLDTDKESQLAQHIRQGDADADESQNRTTIDAVLALMDSTRFIGQEGSEHPSSGATSDQVMETSTEFRPDQSKTVTILDEEPSFQCSESIGSAEWTSDESLPIPTLQAAASHLPQPKRKALRRLGFKQMNREKRCIECGLSLQLQSQRDHVSRLHMDEALFTCRICPWTLRSQRRPVERLDHAESHGQTELDCIVDNTRELAPVLAALLSRLLSVTNVAHMEAYGVSGERLCQLCCDIISGYQRTRHIAAVHLEPSVLLGCKHCPFSISTEHYESYQSPYIFKLMKNHSWNEHKSADFLNNLCCTNRSIRTLLARCFPDDDTRYRCQLCERKISIGRQETHVAAKHQHLPSFTCRLCELQFFLPHQDIIVHHLQLAHGAVANQLTCLDSSSDAGFPATLQLCFPAPHGPGQPSAVARAGRCSECSSVVHSQKPEAWEQHATSHHWEGWLHRCPFCKTEYPNHFPARHLESAHGVVGRFKDLVDSRRPALAELARRLASTAVPIPGFLLRCRLDHCDMIVAMSRIKDWRRWHLVTYHWDALGPRSCGECQYRCPTRTLKHKPGKTRGRIGHCRLAWPALKALMDKAFPST